MKKLLLAAAATSMVAGPVAAQGVDFSGYARFGFDYQEGRAGGFNNDEVAVHSRFRLIGNVSTETDFGATVGAQFRAQSDNNVPMGFNAPRFFVSGGGLTVAVGNITGALESMPGMYFGNRSAGLGVSGLAFHNMAANVSGTAAEGGQFFDWDALASRGAGAAERNGVEAIFSMAGIRAHVSYSDQNPTAPGTRNQRAAASIAYTFGEYTVALGTQQASGNTQQDKWVATFGANFDDFRVNAQAADSRGVKKVVLQGGFNVTPEAEILAFIGNESGNAPGNREFNGTSGGIGLSYMLGGGASFETGVVRTSNSLVRADAGVFFSF
ncbi:MAG: porin [Alkalilacustris sp.]